MTVIALIFLSSGLEANALRDLTKIQSELGDFELKNTAGAAILSRMLGVSVVEKEADFTIVYCSKPLSQETRNGLPENTLIRDFSQKEMSVDYSVNSAPPHLREQGRDGPSLTQIYLNRAHPKGKGIADPFVQNNFG